MSLTKIVTLSAASVLSLATFSAFAGGTETVVPAYASVPSFTPHAYVGIGLGGAYSNWNSFDNGNDYGVKADNGGFAYGGKLGYQASEHFGIEGGIVSLPDSDVSATGYKPKGEIDSWFAYVAGTLRASIIDPNLHVTGKVGGAYRNLDHEGSLFTGVGSGSYSTVMFGTGLDYSLRTRNLPLSVGAEYMMIPSNNSGDAKNQAPSAHVFLATLNYHFAL